MTASDDLRYRRADDLVWRSAPDRVLLQRIDGPPETAATDLLGDVAYVWLAIDTPATLAELAERLADADVDVADLDGDVQYLLVHALITTTPERSTHST
jgi:hypothetical protein